LSTSPEPTLLYYVNAVHGRAFADQDMVLCEDSKEADVSETRGLFVVEADHFLQLFDQAVPAVPAVSNIETFCERSQFSQEAQRGPLDFENASAGALFCFDRSASGNSGQHAHLAELRTRAVFGDFCLGAVGCPDQHFEIVVECDVEGVASPFAFVDHRLAGIK